MAELFVRNSLSSAKAVKFNVSYNEYTLLNDEGRTRWVIVVGTLCPDKDGNSITPTFIHNVSEDTVEDEINKAIASMCKFIDWGKLDDDKYPPYINDYGPKGDNVSIRSKVILDIKDDLPSSGIDLSEAKVIFNNGEVDFDITSECEIKGDPYNYILEWTPPYNGG